MYVFVRTFVFANKVVTYFCTPQEIMNIKFRLAVTSVIDILLRIKNLRKLRFEPKQNVDHKFVMFCRGKTMTNLF